jgi:flagellar FliL protein
MANEKEKKEVKTDAGDTEAPPESKAKGGSTKKLLMFGGFAVVAIALGVVLALFVLKPMKADSGGDGGTKSAQVQSAGEKSKAGDAKSKAGERKRKKKKKEGEESSFIYTIKDIVVNPAGTGGTRFLSVSFAFELESAELQKEFEEREPVIRDALITVLSSKTVAQLTDPKQKEIVRYQIAKKVAKLLRTDELAGVYYTDFVLQ